MLPAYEDNPMVAIKQFFCDNTNVFKPVFRVHWYTQANRSRFYGSQRPYVAILLPLELLRHRWVWRVYLRSVSVPANEDVRKRQGP
ncbi:hypothetical protein ATCV1_z589R [Acanthocystis turfacea chlorella virus 1]|uniref:Uncharacterized protein z589R n=1 Tax=Chlorovirus heliozoae TaxID=322019 RepID=A7K9J9_9PHYC|nr:hypothetical protein ATCV1_z589R [Acanthocystis turfacea chlorella virus 1]ABT16723.1 hypothetical protein ATCV1_z589R [Acanthocystis turfacea chlorella virus 1]